MMYTERDESLIRSLIRESAQSRAPVEIAYTGGRRDALLAECEGRDDMDFWGRAAAYGGREWRVRLDTENAGVDAPLHIGQPCDTPEPHASGTGVCVRCGWQHAPRGHNAIEREADSNQWSPGPSWAGETGA